MKLLMNGPVRAQELSIGRPVFSGMSSGRVLIRLALAIVIAAGVLLGLRIYELSRIEVVRWPPPVRCHGNIRELEIAVGEFFRRENRLPDSLEELVELVSKLGFRQDMIVCPYSGKPYLFLKGWAGVRPVPLIAIFDGKGYHQGVGRNVLIWAPGTRRYGWFYEAEFEELMKEFGLSPPKEE